MLGAKNAGMLPVWFRPDGGEAEGVPVIRSLEELSELLVSLSKEAESP